MRIWGSEVIKRVLPPVVTGPVIMVIGLKLAPVAVGMATSGSDTYSKAAAMTVAFIALATTVLVSLLAKGMIKLIPILVGIAVGYVLALIMGMVSFDAVISAPWVAMPAFVLPQWNLHAVFYIIPVAIAPAIEHFGDIVAIGRVTGKDYLKEPGIQNTMLGDGVATSLAAFLGGPPNTTYSEVTGAVTLTRAFNPAIMTWGRHHRRPAGLYRQTGRVAADHSLPCHGRHHAAAVRGHCRGGVEHPCPGPGRYCGTAELEHHRPDSGFRYWRSCRQVR